MTLIDDATVLQDKKWTTDGDIVRGIDYDRGMMHDASNERG